MLEIFKLSYKHSYAFFANEDGGDLCTCVETNCKHWLHGEKYSYDHDLVFYVANGWKEQVVKDSIVLD